MAMKKPINILINKKTQQDLTNLYDLKYPNGEKSFSTFVELLINRGMEVTW